LSLSQVVTATCCVAGHKVYAHRVIVCARCDVMAAMFSSHFAETTSSLSEVNGYYLITVCILLLCMDIA